MFFKKSIKWELTIIYILLIGMLFGSIAIFNTFYLKQEFVNDRVETLEKTYSALNRFINELEDKNLDIKNLLKHSSEENDKDLGLTKSKSVNDNALMKFLLRIQDTYNVSISLVDNNNVVYNIRGSGDNDIRILSLIFNDFEESEDSKLIRKEENYTIIDTKQSLIDRIRQNQKLSKSFTKYNSSNGEQRINNNGIKPPLRSNRNSFRTIECFGILNDNKTFFYMSSPIASIEEPVQFFNGFLLKVFFVASVLGSIVIYLVSAKLSRPIKDLANVSKKIASLDFSSKYDNKHKREDEIGILGDSINDLSTKLESTIKNLKEANVKLTEDIHKKDQLDIMRQEFVANVSHELKTPIAIISGYAEGLTSGIADTKEDRDYYCEVIMDEAKKMNKIVRQLLNLSSIEKGKEILEIVNINLYNVVEGSVNSLSTIADEKGVKIEINMPKITSIMCDELKVEEIINNYLTNALNHVDENKMVKIWTEDMDDGKLRLCVYNSGLTLSDDNLKQIWEKFYKVDKAHTREYGGSGLGLSIVQSIANQLSTECGAYNIYENNSLKQGICFFFDFTKS